MFAKLAILWCVGNEVLLLVTAFLRGSLQLQQCQQRGNAKEKSVFHDDDENRMIA